MLRHGFHSFPLGLLPSCIMWRKPWTWLEDTSVQKAEPAPPSCPWGRMLKWAAHVGKKEGMSGNDVTRMKLSFWPLMTRIVLTPEMTRWDSRYLLVVFPSWLSSTSPSAHSKLACFDRPVTQRSFYNMAWSYASSSSSMRSWQSQVWRSVSSLATNTWVLLTLCQTNIFHPKAVGKMSLLSHVWYVSSLEGNNYIQLSSEYFLGIFHIIQLGGGFRYFLCSPLLGEMIQFD